jgi:uncharacterized pyridoxal phosphate-containing UPF0001 family protein
MLRKEDVEAALKKIESDLQPDEVTQIIRDMTPNKALELRGSLGSPNPKQQQDMISSAYNKLSVYMEELSKRKTDIKAAFDSLSKDVNRYLNS